MKYIVASDIHGSSYYAKKLLEVFEKENANELILLGDLYYHGPRNPLPKEYNPMEVANMLNGFKSPLHVTKGNCDAEVDEMISNFKFNDNIKMLIGEKRFYFTHGHHENIDNKPDNVDVLVYGHFHTGFIIKKENVVFINTGSTTLPKNNTSNSYLVIEENNLLNEKKVEINLKDLEGNLIDGIKL